MSSTATHSVVPLLRARASSRDSATSRPRRLGSAVRGSVSARPCARSSSSCARFSCARVPASSVRLASTCASSQLADAVMVLSISVPAPLSMLCSACASRVFDSLLKRVRSACRPSFAWLMTPSSARSISSSVWSAPAAARLLLRRQPGDAPILRFVVLGRRGQAQFGQPVQGLAGDFDRCHRRGRTGGAAAGCCAFLMAVSVLSFIGRYPLALEGHWLAQAWSGPGRLLQRLKHACSRRMRIACPGGERSRDSGLVPVRASRVSA